LRRRQKEIVCSKETNMKVEPRNILTIWLAVPGPARRRHGDDDFRFFCETYFADIFHLPWSEDQRRAIRKIEQAVREGGLLALAMRRGSGKTSLCRAAALWAILTGRHKFVYLIICLMADRPRAVLELMKTEFECNEALLRGFPQSEIEWHKEKAILPTVPGILLGALDARAEGAIIYPTLVICDGLQHDPDNCDTCYLPDGRIIFW
jgi:hypothetical protein